MNQLTKILPSVKWDNGVVEKPFGLDKSKGSLDGIEIEKVNRYNNAKTVYPLVERGEFWKLMYRDNTNAVFGQCCNDMDKYISLGDHIITLGDFIPCIDGVPVEEPDEFDSWNNDFHETLIEQKEEDLDLLASSFKCLAYSAALEAVIFEGWKIAKSSNKFHVVIQYKGFELSLNGRDKGITVNSLIYELNELVKNRVQLLWNGKTPKI